MRENIDILAFLEGIVQTNTLSYQEDFQYDIKDLTAATIAQDKEDCSFLWMSYRCGTRCLNERSVFFRESTEHIIWTHYEYEADYVKAYRLTVTGQNNGRPVGNVYPVDYKRHVLFVRKNAVPAESATLTFSNGQTITLPYEQVKGRLGLITEEYGDIVKIRCMTQDEYVVKAIIMAGQRQTESKHKQKSHCRSADKKSKEDLPVR